ncbi:hypothetical protein GYB62_00170 [bacterium]|nr:hypothetical protein [bacterium]
MQKRSLVVAFIICLLPTLSACSYHLRQSAALPTQWQPVLVEGNNVLSKTMRRALLKDGNRITEKRANARSVVDIHEHSIESASYAIDSALQSVEKRIVAHANYSWSTINNSDQSSQRRIDHLREAVESIQIDNPNNITARNAETEFILRELREKLCRQMVRNIAFTAQQQPDSGGENAAQNH